MKWVVIFLAFLNFGYMVFDGGRALVKGSYITPSSGPHKGELGPWSKLASAIGIAPEGNVMKIIFVLWGIAGLMVTFYFFKDSGRYWSHMLIANILSLWYAGMGTMSSLVQIVMLVLIRVL